MLEWHNIHGEGGIEDDVDLSFDAPSGALLVLLGGGGPGTRLVKG